MLCVSKEEFAEYSLHTSGPCVQNVQSKTLKASRKLAV
jgi:hypothetical protein